MLWAKPLPPGIMRFFIKGLIPTRLSSNLGGELWTARNDNVIVNAICSLIRWSPLEQSPPPSWGVKWPRTIVQGWIDIREEVPDVADNDTHDLILGNGAVQDQAKGHENPRKVWSCENQQAQKAQSRIRVPSRPYVNQS